MFNIIIVLTCIVSICRFYVSLSLILFVCIFIYDLYVFLLSVGFMYHYPLILFLCISIYLLKVRDEGPFGANVICFTMYRL